MRTRRARSAAALGAAALVAVLGGCGGGATRTAGTAGAARTTTTSTTTATAPNPRPAPRTTATTPAPPTRTSTTPSHPPSATLPRPPILARPIPFGALRKRETAAYARRHYGLDTYRLTHPHVIVWHFTGSSTFDAAYNTFAPDVADIELHELPGLCAHFVVDGDGTIYQLVPTSIICRHTVGLNWTAIGIEEVGTSDAQILGDPAQLRALLRLTRWLRCRFAIPVADVIGHNESLSSPYHHERVAALRRQTHADWPRADMDGIRSRLRAAGGCENAPARRSLG